jgi:hypothetical protein
MINRWDNLIKQNPKAPGLIIGKYSSLNLLNSFYNMINMTPTSYHGFHPFLHSALRAAFVMQLHASTKLVWYAYECCAIFTGLSN